MEKEGRGIVISKDDFKKYSFWVIIALLFIFSYFILKPYFIALISAFILTYLVRPLYLVLNNRFNRSLSSLISVIFVLVIILLPIGLIMSSLVNQSKSFFESGDFDRVADRLFSHPLLVKYGINLDSLTTEGTLVPDVFKEVFSSIPGLAISLIIALFAIFYMLIHWEEIAVVVKKFIPFHNKDRIFLEISEATNIMVYGTFLIGLMEFVFSAVVFYVIGVKFFMLLSALIFILAFIPIGGPTIVWIPMAIYNILFVSYAKGITLVVMGLILSVGIDFFLRIKVLGNKSKINPLIMLLGLFGGVSVFGIFGFIIGPLILVYSLELVKAFLKDYR